MENLVFCKELKFLNEKTPSENLPCLISSIYSCYCRRLWGIAPELLIQLLTEPLILQTKVPGDKPCTETMLLCFTKNL